MKRIFISILMLLFCISCARQTGPQTAAHDAEVRYMDVIKAVSAQRYPEAIALCEDIINEHPTFYKAYQKIVDVNELMGDVTPAITYFKELVRTYPKNGYAHYGVGLALSRNNDYVAATDYFRDAIEFVPNFADAYGYKGLVDAYVKLEKLDIPLKYFQNRLKNDPKNPNLHYGIGYIYRKQKDYDKALDFLEKSLDLNKNLWQSYRSIGLVHYFSGRYKKALSYWREEEKVDLRNNNLEVRAQVIGNIGALLIGLEDYPQALMFSQKALEIDMQVGNQLGQENRLSNIGSIYLDLGDYGKAVSKYEQALALAEKINHQERRAGNLVNLGIAYHHLEAYAQMIEAWVEALQIYEAQRNQNEQITTLSNIGYGYIIAEEYNKAQEYLAEALLISDEKASPGVRGSLENNLGLINLRLEKPGAALPHFKKALKIGKKIHEPALVWEALAGIASIHELQGENKDALKQYKKAIDVIEKVRETLGTESFKSGYLKDKVRVYESIIRLQKKMHEGEPRGGFDRDAFRYAERAKARAFLDLLAESNADIQTSVDPELLEKEYVLYDTIAGLQAAFQEAESDSQMQAIDAQLAETRSALESLKIEMRLKNPRYADLKYPQPVSVSHVQKKLLHKDAVFLQYILGDKGSFLFALSKNEFQIFDLPPRRELMESVTLFRSMLLNPRQFSFKVFASRANKLYRSLIAPAQSIIGDKQELMISPDGILHYLPFDVLITERVQQGLSLTAGYDYDLPYLFKKQAICYGPSATVLSNLGKKDKKQAPNAYLAYGDPVFGDINKKVVQDTLRGVMRDANEVTSSGFTLRAVSDELVLRYATGAPSLRAFRAKVYQLPNSRTEVEGISKLYSAQGTKVFVGEAASEENVKKNQTLADYRYLHFATHGLINENRPAYSGLVLTLDDDANEDGFLQMPEIFNLNLNADMVALSACQTGLGKIVRGEGVIGLTRAFMYAGSPSVMVTLWNVADESTSLFMRNFYRNLEEKQLSHVKALQQTKLEMLKNSDYKHPFYWAPFSLVGS